MDSMAYHAVTENGSRRFGASQPMRITASCFGSLDPPHTRLWRDRSALERELPSNRLLADLAPTGGSTLKHEGRRQTDRRSADAGSRLKLIDAWGRSRLIRQPFSRNGENSPYGMLERIVETSASFEARSAPRSYPTSGVCCGARVRLWPRLCEKSARYICTLNFEGCGHAESKKALKFLGPHSITTKSDRVFAQPGP
jgi:hypothetical protein